MINYYAVIYRPYKHIYIYIYILSFTVLRQRTPPSAAMSRSFSIGTPLPVRRTPYPSSSTTTLRSVASGSATHVPTTIPLPRAILPKERSVLDKMVDYLIGDGPSNRYALICKQCFGHNGKYNFLVRFLFICNIYCFVYRNGCS